MAKKTPQLIRNSAGGIDLLVERDSGNEVLIRTGKPECSKEFWEKMKDLAEVALNEMEQ